jgi:hypothetical protein
VEFQPQNIRYFRELIERWIGPTILEVGQAAQGDPSQLRQVTLTKAKMFPPTPEPGSNFLGGHRLLWRIILRFSASPRQNTPYCELEAHPDALL